MSVEHQVRAQPPGQIAALIRDISADHCSAAQFGEPHGPSSRHDSSQALGQGTEHPIHPFDHPLDILMRQPRADVQMYGPA